MREGASGSNAPEWPFSNEYFGEDYFFTGARHRVSGVDFMPKWTYVVFIMQ
jgi:hypothetical protein